MTTRISTDNIQGDALTELSKLSEVSKTSAYTLTTEDIGKYINITTGGITVPENVFSAGDVVSVYNNSESEQVVASDEGVTMYLVGTDTVGNRTVAQRGLVTILCVGTNTFVIGGGGLT